jgi:hypothetical protein
MITARSIIKDTFWALEQDGAHYGILRRMVDDHFLVSSSTGERIFQNIGDLTKLGMQFCEESPVSDSTPFAVRGYPTVCKPCSPVYDVRRKIPMFTKSELSKSMYCAGYYIIQFDKGWVKSFCPKLITIERYEFKGPFKTENELRQELANVKPN